MAMFSSLFMSAMVLASFIVLWTTLPERLRLLAAWERKSLQLWSRGMIVCSSLAVMCALALMGRPLNLCCWMVRAATTFFLRDSEFSH